MKIESYISKIIEETGLSRKEIQDRVEEKKVELKGLISEEGALFIIAKELGVDVKEENKDLLKEIEINISDISLNMKNISIAGRVKEINRISSFNKKDGGVGHVGSFLLTDSTGDIRITLWDENVNILNDNDFKVNELVKIVNGYAKSGRYGGVEIHVGRNGKVIPSPEDIDYKKYPKIKSEVIKIGEVNLSQKSISIEGNLLRKNPIKEFTRKNGEVGKVGSLTIMDATGSIRVTFWNEDTEKIIGCNEGDFVSISNLNPRLSSLDNKTIDLFANRGTIITKDKKAIKLEGKGVKKIKDLQIEKGIVTFQGIISSIEDLRKINLKSGEEVSLLGFTVSDETDGVRITLWSEKAEEFSEILAAGKGVLLKNVMVKYSSFSSRNEIALLKDSSIELIDLNISDIKNIEPTQRDTKPSFTMSYTKIDQINSAGTFEIKGFIAKPLDNIIIYEACTKCSRKITNCQCDVKGESENRMIFNLLIDDGTGTIRTTFAQSAAEKIVGEETDIIATLKETPDFQNYMDKLNSEILGKDIIIKGRAKFSDFSSTYELSAQGFHDINIDDELENVMKEIET